MSKMLIFTLFAIAWLSVGLSQAEFPCRFVNGVTDTLMIVKNATENMDIGTIIQQIKFEPAQPPDIELEVLATNPYFTVVTDKSEDFGNLVVTKPFDREKDVQKQETTLRCADTRGNIGRNEIQLRVRLLVQDLNEFAPRFTKPEYVVTMSELTLPESIIASGIKATDEDITNINTVYKITDSTDRKFLNYFEIETPTKGEVTLKKSIAKFEGLDKIVLTITAKDNHPDSEEMPKNSTTNLTIIIEDGDDLNPVFTRSAYEDGIPVTAQPGDRVQPDRPIHAYDGDLGINASVVYSFVPNPTSTDADYFAIDANTGEVQVKRIPFGKSTYSLLIKATQADNKDRSTTATLTVHIYESGITRPLFKNTPYKAYVPENVKVGTTVLTCVADDADPNSFLKYSISDASGNFKIETLTGQIKVARALDFETTTEYNFEVTVTDGTFKNHERVSIRITDINDHNPKFERAQYRFEVTDRTEREIGTVSATDDDGGQIGYMIESFSTIFRIGSFSGLITVIDPDLVKPMTYRLTVVAQDAGVPPRKDVVTVEIVYGNATTDAGAIAFGNSGSQTPIIIVFAVLTGILFFVLVALLVVLCKKKSKSSRDDDSIENAAGTLESNDYMECHPKLDFTLSSEAGASATLSSFQKDTLRSESSGISYSKDHVIEELESKLEPIVDEPNLTQRTYSAITNPTRSPLEERREEGAKLKEPSIGQFETEESMLLDDDEVSSTSSRSSYQPDKPEEKKVMKVERKGGKTSIIFVTDDSDKSTKSSSRASSRVRTRTNSRTESAAGGIPEEPPGGYLRRASDQGCV